MAYVTLLVIMAASVAGFYLCRQLVRIFADAGMARRNYRVTVEGLAERAHKAAKADRERARDSSEVAEATRMLAQQVSEVKDTLALERKLRKAIRSTVPPLPPTHGPEERNERPGTGASA